MIFSVLSHCSNDADYQRMGKPALEGWFQVTKLGKARKREIAKAFDDIYSSPNSHNELGQILEWIVFKTVEINRNRLLSSVGRKVAYHEAKIKDELDNFIDIEEVGSGHRNFDGILALENDDRFVLEAWALEAKYNLDNFLRDDECDRKLRYMEYVPQVVPGFSSFIISGLTSNADLTKLESYTNISIKEYRDLWASSSQQRCN